MTFLLHGGGRMHRRNRDQMKGVFEELEALGLSIPEPKPEPKKRGRKPKPKNLETIKPKRPRGRPRKDTNQSVGLL